MRSAGTRRPAFIPSRRMRWISLVAAILPVAATAQTPPRTILAIGAHAGDAEVTSGALLIRQHKKGDRIVILHMTLGEGGNPKMSPAAYGAQKRREALAADSVIGAESIFAPYKDGEIPNDEAARRYVADVIRQVKPTYIITHWKNSIHKDHSNTSAIVQDAVLLASLPGVVTAHPAYRGIRGIWYAETGKIPKASSPTSPWMCRTKSRSGARLSRSTSSSGEESRVSDTSSTTTLFRSFAVQSPERCARCHSTSTASENGACWTPFLEPKPYFDLAVVRDRQ